MEVVYFFCESSFVRIPLLNYDQRLFRLLSEQRGGAWDRFRQEFIFRQNSGESSLPHDRFRRIFAAIPSVWIESNSDVHPLGTRTAERDHPPFCGDSVKVFGFLGREWKNSGTKIPAKPELKNRRNFPFSFNAALSLPEKFSENWQAKLDAELRARKYSHRTIRAYIYFNRQICRLLQKPPEEISPDDVTKFLASLEKTREYSASSLNLALSAIKFFFKNILKNESISEHNRPRHDKRLPPVLSKEEIGKILNMETNPKHRLLLMLAYSSGLRVSEVVALKREHIDLSRKVIYIRLGKGRKDRSTILSEKAASFFIEYCALNSIQTWLFPGQSSASHLTIRSAQHIFEKAVHRAEIHKKTSIHSLRHTFATHLLESGTDIRYIQSLLGHANLRTTERYTHVARRSVLSIKSPLDSIL